MTVAITGSSGFLGSALVKLFSAHDIKVICLVRDVKENSKSANIFFIKYNKSLSEDNVVSELKKFAPDTFIHCAWRGVSGDDRKELFQLSYNVQMTLDSVHLAHDAGCKKWIGTGSQAEYGNKNYKITEKDSTLPHTLYGKAKLEAGISALNLCSKLNIAGTWNRVFSLYGPEDNSGNFIPYIINSLIQNEYPKLTKCEQQWDYLYIDDAAEAYYLQCIKDSSGLFNLCSGETILLNDVVILIQKFFNSKTLIGFGEIPYSENQTMVLAGNCDKIKAQINWSPKTTFEEGLKQTVNYYMNIEGI